MVFLENTKQYRVLEIFFRGLCGEGLSVRKLADEYSVSTKTITRSINELKDFLAEYKEYLASFGAIMADGIELSGIAKSEHRNVVSLTKKEWELNSKVPHTMYVIENTCVDGIIIWQDTNGLIYQSSPASEPRQIAPSLADYISSRV